jgi:cardiolipin synthase (CMP-forming)
VWGGILDPLADKVFIGCLASGLCLQGLLPAPLLGLMLGRDLFLVCCAVLFRAIERPEGAAFFDSDTATFEIVPTRLSKVLVGASGRKGVLA